MNCEYENSDAYDLGDIWLTWPNLRIIQIKLKVKYAPWYNIYTHISWRVQIIMFVTWLSSSVKLQRSAFSRSSTDWWWCRGRESCWTAQ